MAVAMIADVPGMSAEQDDALLRAMGLEDSRPSGGLLRIAGPVDGGWRVVTVWESEEAWETFRRERLEPALQAAGQATTPPVQTWPVHSLVIASGREQAG
jgi:hypothetical protein